MSYLIEYSSLLNPEELLHVPKKDLQRIKASIEAKLTMHPDVFGKPLQFSLKGFRSLRVGDYRVIFKIEEQKVRIFLIAHRSIVYERYNKRLSE